MLWRARTINFGERMKAVLTSSVCWPEPSRHKPEASPRTQEEAQEMAERIKKELIACAKRQVLSEGGEAARKAAIEALVDDKLKLQAAKKLGVEVRDNEVEEALAARIGLIIRPDGDKPDINEFYARFKEDGIRRGTIQAVFHVQLAWRSVIRHIYGARHGSIDPENGTGEKLSRRYLLKLRQKASIEYRGSAWKTDTQIPH